MSYGSRGFYWSKFFNTYNIQPIALHHRSGNAFLIQALLWNNVSYKKEYNNKKKNTGVIIQKFDLNLRLPSARPMAHRW